MSESNPAGMAEDIRWIFGSFLFAVVVAEIASKFSKLALKWRSLGQHRLSLFTHLLLASVIVVTSWIGWSIGTAKGYYAPVNEVFGLPTLELLFDLLILTFYFILVAGIRVPDDEGEWLGNDADHVSRWCVVILITYLLWDWLTYIVIPYPYGHFGPSMKVSLIVVGLALAANLMLRGIRRDQPKQVVIADMSWIFLFLLFRASKQFVFNLFPIEQQHLPPPTPPMLNPLFISIWVMLAMFLVTAVAALVWSLRSK